VTYTRIAIVARAFPLAEEERLERRGFVVVLPPGGPAQSFAIESTTQGGLRVEMRTLLDRYVGEPIEVAVYAFDSEDSRLGADTVAELVPSRRVNLKQTSVRRNRFKPFNAPWLGHKIDCWIPAWYVPEERPSLLKAIDFDVYSAPASGDETKTRVKVRNKIQDAANRKERYEASKANKLIGKENV
jgi:hypothetical protein